MQTLGDSSKVTRKEAKKIAALAAQQISKNESAQKSISSPNVSVPTKSSSFYTNMKQEMDLKSPLLTEEVTANNYVEKFRHLLCWEEQEHDKQLAQRYGTMTIAIKL